MGESTCLVHGFSYASAIPNESKQGNPVHVLGESISFGRYMNESLSWERWSTFSHKKYVEEAERYAQPGSVAQKKAFFEAHYKKIAAQKAAALLEQEKAAKREAEKDGDLYPEDQETALLSSFRSDVDEKIEESTIEGSKNDDVVICNEQSGVDVEEIGKFGANVVITGIEANVKRNSFEKLDGIENQGRVSVSEGSGTPQIERPLLKHNSVASEDVSSVASKKRTSLSSLKSTIRRKSWRIPDTPAKPFTPLDKKDNSVTGSARKSNEKFTDKKRLSPKSLRALMSLIHTKEPDKESTSASKKASCSAIAHISFGAPKDCATPLRTPLSLIPTTEPHKEPTSASKKASSSSIALISSRTPKDCATPLRTPLVSAGRSVAKHPAVTPQSENKRMKTPIHPSANGSKTTGPKWHILSSVSKSLSGYRKKLQSPTSLTPFILRTEEIAAKRKQKLEEKFNANEVQKMQPPQRTLKEKAGNEFRKLSHSFCFKARPLPEFYKEREVPKTPMKKTPAVAQSQPGVLTRNNSNKKQGTVSLPLPPPPPMTTAKTIASKNLALKMNIQNLGKSLTTSLPERITHENTSPNIQ